MRKKLLRKIYYHECKYWGCIVITDNKDQCRFCGKKRWKLYLKIYDTGEEKTPTLLEKIFKMRNISEL